MQKQNQNFGIIHKKVPMNFQAFLSNRILDKIIYLTRAHHPNNAKNNEKAMNGTLGKQKAIPALETKMGNNQNHK